MERQVQQQAGLDLSGAKISQDETLNFASLSPEQRKTLTRIGAAALVAAGVIAPENAEAVTLIQLNDNGLNGLKGVGSGWNGGAGSGMAVEKFTIDSPTVLTEASAIANLRIGLDKYTKPITDPQWQTFAINIYKDVNGVPESLFTPTYHIAVNSSMVQLTPTSLVDNNNQAFYKVQMSINQLIEQPGTYYLGLGFDARPHGGSSNPVLNTNVEGLVPLGDSDMSLFAGRSNGNIWSGLRDPSTGLYANINTGLEGQPVPEPGTMLVVLAGLGVIAGRRIKGLVNKN